MSEALREVWFVLHGHGQLAAYFIRHFSSLDDGSRLVVAPEALNRFYREPTSLEGGDQSRVGATWMTREDRLVEIEDYVRYLDALQHEVWTTIVGRPRGAFRCTVLGFSQGVATAMRWACLGRIHVDTLILWAGVVPPELDERAVAPLRASRIVRVLGDRDELARSEAVSVEDQRFGRLNLRHEVVRFDGGHEISSDVLQRIVG